MTYTTPAAIIVVSILFPVLGSIAVSLRFYTRANSKVKLWIDDWLTVPALLLEYVLAGLIIWGATTKSLGDLLPPPNVPGPDGYLFSDSDQQIRLQQIQYHFDWIGVFPLGLIKLSILFFYLRVFCTRVGKSTFELVIKAMIVLVIAWMTAFGLGAILLCGTHPEFAWAPVAVVAEKCSAQLPFLEGYAISDFILDVLIWSLPIPKIWALNMTVRRRLAVIAVFLVGLLTIAASATRMGIYIRYVVNAFAESDGETLITYLLFWTMIECGFGLIVVCLPTLRALYGNISPGSILSGIKSAFNLRSVQSRSSTEPGIHRLDSLDRVPKASASHSEFNSESDGTSVMLFDLERQADTHKGVGTENESKVEQY